MEEKKEDLVKKEVKVKDPDNFSFFGKKIKAEQVVIAIIGIVGVIVGTLISIIAQSYLWESQKEYQEKQLKDQQDNIILDKKLELIKQTAELLGQSASIEIVWDMFVREKVVDPNTGKILNINSKEDVEFAEKLSEYQSKFLSTLVLENCFFGEETKKNVTKIINGENKNLWQTKGSTWNELINTLFKELHATSSIHTSC